LQVLYRQYKLRYEPFEWVYDGLKPLLLPNLLSRRKGAPLTLAAAAAAVGRRLGVPLVPLPADGWGDGTAAGPSIAPDLPADLEQRIKRSTQAAPSQGQWLLWLEDGRVAKDAGCSSLLFLEASKGKLLSGSEAAAAHPGLLAAGPAAWHERAPLLAWRGVAAAAVQAHQRRGESDLVAHWSYVLMALDPGAEAWDHVLGPQG
jgi:hypothetical protein